MPIQNQQTDLVQMVTINGSGITVGNQEFSVNKVLQHHDAFTASDRLRRYRKPSKRTVTLAYSWMPSTSDFTVDGREGRDFLINLARNAPQVAVTYIDEANVTQSFNAYITDYQETVTRRDPVGQCVYYEVNMLLEEI